MRRPPHKPVCASRLVPAAVRWPGLPCLAGGWKEVRGVGGERTTKQVGAGGQAHSNSFLSFICEVTVVGPDTSSSNIQGEAGLGVVTSSTVQHNILWSEDQGGSSTCCRHILQVACRSLNWDHLHISSWCIIFRTSSHYHN